MARYSEAAEFFQRMYEAGAALGDPFIQSRALIRQANVLGRQGNMPGSLEKAELAEQIAESAGAKEQRTEAIYLRGTIAFYSGKHEAKELLDLALELSRVLGLVGQQARCINMLAGVYWSMGQYQQSMTYLEEALTLAKELGDRFLEMNIESNLGELAEALGDYSTALNHYQAAIESSRVTGLRDSEINFLSNLGGVRLHLNDYAGAENDLRRVISLTDEARNLYLGETYRYLSTALMGQERHEEALEAALHAISLGQQAGMQLQIGAGWAVLGIAALALGREVTVIEDTGTPITCDCKGCFDKGMAIYEQIGTVGDRAKMLRLWAEAEFKYGNPDYGKELWWQARDLFKELGAEFEAERMSDEPNPNDYRVRKN
jgi:tetratricopeptide (TPR) repeat protein